MLEFTSSRRLAEDLARRLGIGVVIGESEARAPPGPFFLLDVFDSFLLTFFYVEHDS
jgi:hypothetical protein